ncbi:MAG: FG-GAP repeat protein [Elusimicrobia bacterium]|nr:FG-GAP repeat protein [Elusimicrobiota bacterium]
MFNKTLLSLALCFSAGLLRATVLSTERGEPDITLHIDRYTADGRFGAYPGDFDGDGHRDLAISLDPGTNRAEIHIVRGPLPHLSRLETVISMTIFSRFTNHYYAIVSVGDVNGDGKDDLLIGNNVLSEPGSVDIVFGRENLSGTLDLDLSAADLTIWGASLAKVGNFNQDHLLDLIVSDFYRGKTHIIYGTRPFPTGTYDLDASTPSVTFTHPLGPSAPVIADINNDNLDDIIIPAKNLHVVWGSNALPQNWVFASTPANVTIMADAGVGSLYCRAAGDFGGDGRADLLAEVLLSGPEDTILIDGTSLLSGNATIDVIQGNLNFVPSTPIPINYFRGVTMGDFDGDGRSDISSDVFVFLSSDYPSTGQIPPVFGTTSVTISGDTIHSSQVEDLNGDKFEDLILVGLGRNISLPGPAIYGALYCFYGFRPLKTPSLQVVNHTEDSRWATVTLGVTGDPTEMKFSGDVADSIKDQWIPYQTPYRLALSSPEGSKSLQVKFRNAFLRESESVQQSMSVTVGTSQVTTVANRVRPGRPAAFDCHLTTLARVRAWVYTLEGEEIRSLPDQESSAGIVPIEWDGRNNAGKSVAPGVYVLVIDVDGKKERRNVVVQ